MKCDTKKLNELVESYKVEIDYYKMAIDAFFDRIPKIPTETKEWVGQDAEKYIEYILESKQEYYNFYESLIRFSNLLQETSSDLEKYISKNKLGVGNIWVNLKFIKKKYLQSQYQL